MFIAAVHVYVKPDKVDEFKHLIRANYEGSIAEPGCLRFDVAQSKEDPTAFLLWECYVDEAARDAHRETAHYQAFKATMPELMSKDRRSDLYEGVYIDSDKLG
jgi:(4S)-4-hydroxy-5-phosphonooxypentane-2,3-dione isomerase